MGDRTYLSIGDVLSLLREEFPDITISKIRFLESRGLLIPERTPSGYRKFYDRDVERLRWILQQQREHFLPLKVIKGRLEGAEGSEQAESLLDPAEAPPRAVMERASEIAEMPSANGTGHPSVGAAPFRSGSRTATLTPVASQEISGTYGETVATLTGTREEDVTGGEIADQPSPPSPAGGGGAGSARHASDAEEGAAGDEGASGTERAGGGTERVGDMETGTTSREHSGRGRKPKSAATGAGGGMTAGELAQASSLSIADVEQLESFGLIEGRTVAGVHSYDAEALQVATLAASLAAFGIEARHLRIFKHAAERQAGLYSQIVLPLLRQRNPEARSRALEELNDLSELGRAMQDCFLRAARRELTGE